MIRNDIDALVEKCHAEREAKAAVQDKYGWRDDAEREQAMAEIAERQRRDAHDEAVAWAKARNAERAEAEQAQAEPTRIQQKAEPMTQQPTDAAYWDSWRTFVRKTMRADVRKSEDRMADCVGEVLVRVQKRHQEALDEVRQKLETELCVVRQELATVRREVGEMQAEAKVRGALDEVTQRLDRIEHERSARQPLKAISG